MPSEPGVNKDESPAAKVLHKVEDATGGRAHRQPAGEQKESNVEAAGAAGAAEDADSADGNRR